MAIISVSDTAPDPIPVPGKPQFRQNPPPRLVRKSAIIDNKVVDYVGNLPTIAEVNEFLNNKTNREIKENQFNSAISGFSFNGTTLAQLKEMTNAEFDTWWDTNIDTTAKALVVLKLLARAAVRRLL